MKKCHTKVVNRRRVAVSIGTLVLHESLLVSVLIYDSEAMIWKEEERFRIRVVQMDNGRGLLGIRIVDKVQNAWTRELSSGKRGG